MYKTRHTPALQTKPIDMMLLCLSEQKKNGVHGYPKTKYQMNCRLKRTAQNTVITSERVSAWKNISLYPQTVLKRKAVV